MSVSVISLPTALGIVGLFGEMPMDQRDERGAVDDEMQEAPITRDMYGGNKRVYSRHKMDAFVHYFSGTALESSIHCKN